MILYTVLYFVFMGLLSLFMLFTFFGGVIYYEVFTILRLPVDNEKSIDTIEFKNCIKPF